MFILREHKYCAKRLLTFKGTKDIDKSKEAITNRFTFVEGVELFRAVWWVSCRVTLSLGPSQRVALGGAQLVACSHKQAA